MKMHLSVCEGINKSLPTPFIIRIINENTIIGTQYEDATNKSQKIFIITTQITMANKLSMRITKKKTTYDEKLV